MLVARDYAAHRRRNDLINVMGSGDQFVNHLLTLNDVLVVERFAVLIERGPRAVSCLVLTAAFGLRDLP
jgi:hypothetical protein